MSAIVTSSSAAERFASADGEDLDAWLARHEQLLRPFGAVTAPGGLTPRMCLDLARSALRHRAGRERAALDCVMHVLRAYRTAGRLDRRGEATAWCATLLRAAAQHDAAGSAELAAALRREADEDWHLMLALESTEHGIG